MSRSQTEVQNHLLGIQSEFQGKLLSNVETFHQDTSSFYTDYDTVSAVYHDSTCMNFRIIMENVKVIHI